MLLLRFSTDPRYAKRTYSVPGEVEIETSKGFKYIVVEDEEGYLYFKTIEEKDRKVYISTPLDSAKWSTLDAHCDCGECRRLRREDIRYEIGVGV